MLIDFAHPAAPERFAADVCIIGGGPAGITLARRLAERRLRILLLESGGLDHDAATAALGVGDNVGMPYYDLQDSRLRFFGGTTNIWGGRCARLDAIDFERRDWVRHSGWPISQADLVEGYERAERDLRIGPLPKETPSWPDGPQSLRLDAHRFAIGRWRFDTLQERFSGRRARDVLHGRETSVVIHATATQLLANAGGNGLDHVEVRNRHGRQGKVAAKVYVLACGGIENARLLLASRKTAPQGVGNRHGQVGRFFMEHPHGRLGRIDTAQPQRLWSAFRMRFPSNGPPTAPVLLAVPSWQRRRRMLNTALTFALRRNPAAGVPAGRRAYNALKTQLAPERRNRLLWHAYRGLRQLHNRCTRPFTTKLWARLPSVQLSVMVRAEQTPNPDSRVLLSDQCDQLGCPKANLDWRLSAQDKHTLRELAEALNDELMRLQLGALRPEPWLYDGTDNWPVDPTVGNHPIGGYHHMGATRMSRRPEDGVVDCNLAVHGYRNLYVLGSSVFPTGGWANPTLTILALAHRLADHLASQKPLLPPPEFPLANP